MAKKINNLGRSGEQIAARFLESKGLKVLERNWRYGRLEIDLILKDGPQIVFLEVKTACLANRNLVFGYFKRRQIERIKKAALVYVRRHGFCLEHCRFDLLAVVVDAARGTGVVRHFADVI